MEYYENLEIDDNPRPIISKRRQDTLNKNNYGAHPHHYSTT